MRSVFFPRLVNGPFGDPALYVHLAHRGEALLFDCGDLHRLTVRELLKVRAVFVSHAHIDHLVGFDGLLRAFLYRDLNLQLFGPPGIIRHLQGRLSGYTWNLTAGYPFRLTVQEWLGDRVQRAEFRAHEGFRLEMGPCVTSRGGILYQTPYCSVRAAALDHGDITSLAFVLEEPLHVAIHRDALERHGYVAGPWLTTLKDRVFQGAPLDSELTVPLAGGESISRPLSRLLDEIAGIEQGMKICYVTDVSPSPENLALIETLAYQSHLLVIEAVFSHHELDRAVQRNHLTARLAGLLARRAGVARLQVFHHSPRYQHQPDLLAHEAEAAFRGTDGED
ncbi:MAG: MBL fold metallo-hydrolase [Syntrophotaleaceae bacterium]